MKADDFARRMIAPISQVWNFKGRMRRADFWPYMVLLALIYAASFILGVFIFRPSFAISPVSFVFGVVAFLVLLAFAAVVRRMHDVGWRGVWMTAYVILVLIFVVYYFYWRALLTGGGSMSEIFWPLAMAHNLVQSILVFLIIVICAMGGTVGPNRFGADPKAHASAE